MDNSEISRILRNKGLTPDPQLAKALEEMFEEFYKEIEKLIDYKISDSQ